MFLSGLQTIPFIVTLPTQPGISLCQCHMLADSDIHEVSISMTFFGCLPYLASLHHK